MLPSGHPGEPVTNGVRRKQILRSQLQVQLRHGLASARTGFPLSFQVLVGPKDRSKEMLPPPGGTVKGTLQNGAVPHRSREIKIYGYLKRVQSSRLLKCEAQRNVEPMRLTRRLAPGFKTISNFLKDHGDANRRVRCEFVVPAVR